MGEDRAMSGLREFNALKDYPEPKFPRIADRQIDHKIIASYRGEEFFDGDRKYGYGGLRDDGRWEPIARFMCEEYQPESVLQLGCEKGFLLNEFLRLNPLMRIRGMETSLYARNNAIKHIRLGIRLQPYIPMPWGYREFDLVIAIGIVYTLSLHDAIHMLKEIQRVGKRAFITLGSYDTYEDLKLMRQWTLLGTTLLRRDEWIDVMEHAGYQGDYWFVDAESLKLCASS